MNFGLVLDNALGDLPEEIKDNAREKIMLWVKEENDRYFFSHNQSEGIFNTVHILYSINKLMNNKQILDSWNFLDVFNTLHNFLSDPHTLPSQTTLELIVNNSFGKSILLKHSINAFFILQKA